MALKGKEVICKLTSDYCIRAKLGGPGQKEGDDAGNKVGKNRALDCFQVSRPVLEELLEIR